MGAKRRPRGGRSTADARSAQEARGTEEARGAAAVEFAIAGGLVVLLFFAVVELAVLLNAQLVLNSAAREGARRAAVDGGDSAGARRRIAEELGLGRIDAGAVTVVIQPRQATYGTTVTVRLEYAYRFMTPLLRQIAGGPVQLSAAASARSERVPRDEPP